MGTNYYVYDRFHNKHHIGKSSSGWAFGLHVMPLYGINTLTDWLPLLLENSDRIYTECETPIELESLLATIASRSSKPTPEKKAICRFAWVSY